MPAMELRQLEHFIAVAEHGSITGAARTLHLVQSSLSGSINALERQLGATLLLRGRGGTSLTAAGSALLPRARETVECAAAAQDAVAALTGSLHGTVRIASVPLAPHLGLMSTIGAFRRRYPGVHVQVAQSGSAGVLAALREGSCDWGVAPLDGETGIEFGSLLQEPVVLLVGSGHPLVGRRAAAPLDLAGGQVIHLPRNYKLRRLMDGWLAVPGLDQPATIEVDDWASVMTLVGDGVGVGYGTRSYFDPAAHPSVRLVELDQAPVFDVGVATRSNRRLAASADALLRSFVQQCSVPRPATTRERPPEPATGPVRR